MNQKLKIIISFLVLVIILISGWWFFCKQVYSNSDKKTLPSNLLIASQSGLVNIKYNPSSETYEKREEKTLSDITAIVRCKNDIYLTTKKEILKFNNKFKRKASKKFREIGAVASDNENIYISADGHFVVLNKSLKELSKVFLGKNAHDILIYNNTAYLLDNIVLPVFIFRIDIKNPGNIKITEKIVIEYVYPHLQAQWLNPELKQWMVVLGYTHQVGSGQIVYIYSTNKGKEPLAKQTIFSRFRIPVEKAKESIEGFKVLGITSFSPVWAVVCDAESKYRLCQVKSRDNKVSFCNFIELFECKDIYRKVIIKRKDGFLFIVSSNENALKIIDIKHKPEIILSRNLSEFNIKTVVDIVPY